MAESKSRGSAISMSKQFLFWRESSQAPEFTRLTSVDRARLPRCLVDQVACRQTDQRQTVDQIACRQKRAQSRWQNPGVEPEIQEMSSPGSSSWTPVSAVSVDLHILQLRKINDRLLPAVCAAGQEVMYLQPGSHTTVMQQGPSSHTGPTPVISMQPYRAHDPFPCSHTVPMRSPSTCSHSRPTMLTILAASFSPPPPSPLLPPPLPQCGGPHTHCQGWWMRCTVAVSEKMSCACIWAGKGTCPNNEAWRPSSGLGTSGTRWPLKHSPLPHPPWDCCDFHCWRCPCPHSTAAQDRDNRGIIFWVQGS